MVLRLDFNFRGEAVPIYGCYITREASLDKQHVP
jgi:hypothetical protein